MNVTAPMRKKPSVLPLALQAKEKAESAARGLKAAASQEQERFAAESARKERQVQVLRSEILNMMSFLGRRLRASHLRMAIFGTLF